MKNTKKALACALCTGALAFSLTACGNTQNASSGDSGNSDSNAQQSQEKQQATKQQSDVSVSIDGVKQSTNYKGESMAVVTYTLTNNSSDDPVSFSSACYVEAFQNGTQCESTYGQNGGDSQAQLTKVQKGSSKQLTQCYALNGTSDLEVNVYRIGIDRTKLASQTFQLS